MVVPGPDLKIHLDQWASTSVVVQRVRTRASCEAINTGRKPASPQAHSVKHAWTPQTRDAKVSEVAVGNSGTFGRHFRSHISESSKQSYIRRIKPKFAARSAFYHICVIKYAVCATGRLIYLDLVKFRVRTTLTVPQCWSRQKKSCWRLTSYRLIKPYMPRDF